MRYRKEIIAVLIILAVGMVLNAPMLLGGFPSLGDDGAIHGMWSRNFISQWQQGEWYPRWLTSMNQGQGSPAFFYYAPLPYWVTSLLSFGPVGDDLPWFALGRSIALALVLSGLTAYLWLRDIAPRKAALAGSILYMILPYHLAIDLYARAALGEFWAFAWLPLILYFALEIAKRVRSVEVGLPVAGFAFSFGLLALTHLPTTLILTPVITAYLLLGIEGRRRDRVLAIVVSLFALGLGAGLAAIFLIPALMLQKFIGLHDLGKGINAYGNFFLTLHASQTPRDFLYATILTFGLCCGSYWIAQRYTSTKHLRARRFWLFVSFYAVFMMTSPSWNVWKYVRVLQTIQFPWRFNVVLALASVALATLALGQIRKWKPPVQRVFLSLLALSACCGMFLSADRVRRDYLQSEERAVNAVKLMPLRRIADPLEFRIVWAVNADNPQPSLSSGQKTHEFQTEARLIGEGEAILRNSAPRKLLFEVHALRAGRLTIGHFFFPGWQGWITRTAPVGNLDGEPSGTALAITPSRPNGLMMVSVPAGTSFVRLQLNSTRSEQWGRSISLISLVVILGIGSLGGVKLLQRRKKQKS